MKIIVENKVPFIHGVLEPAGEVLYLPAAEITPAAMCDADALITRTRTRCDASLLSGSRCRFIATATIGTDHIDLPWCRDHGITVANAPGCNAPAVAQYVMAAAIAEFGPDLRGLTIGIIGVGNVGRIVESWAHSLGMKVLPNDPPRALAEGPGAFTSLDRIAAEADIVTLHTPLTSSGPFPTFHLAGDSFFRQLARRPLFINAARGPVTDTQALIAALENGLVRNAAIDCWEGEPEISPRLLQLARYATPHIAGYSRQGKIRATAMSVAAFERHFNVKTAPFPVELPREAPASVTADEITSTYDILADTRALKHDPASFEALRNDYQLREEPRGNR